MPPLSVGTANVGKGEPEYRRSSNDFIIGMVYGDKLGLDGAFGNGQTIFAEQ
jgi:hypothetical protein